MIMVMPWENTAHRLILQRVQVRDKPVNAAPTLLWGVNLLRFVYMLDRSRR